MKKIIISGGTGLIGKRLITELSEKEYDIIVITRKINKSINFISKENVSFFEWDYNNSSEEIINLLNDSYSIINLTGASIAGKRWSGEYKKVLYESRIITTRKIVEAISKCSKKPESFISSSAIGYYGTTGNEILTEESQSSDDFLANLCFEWEYEACKANEFGVRTVCIRTGLVIDGNDGAMKKIVLPFKLFIGGHLGTGKQWFSWIHINDLVNLYLFSINNINIKGALNGTSPKPVTNKEFCKTLGKVLKRPSFIPVPGFALKLIIGEFAQYLVTGRKVIPKSAIENGYAFEFPDLISALNNLFKKNDR